MSSSFHLCTSIFTKRLNILESGCKLQLSRGSSLVDLLYLSVYCTRISLTHTKKFDPHISNMVSEPVFCPEPVTTILKSDSIVNRVVEYAKMRNAKDPGHGPKKAKLRLLASIILPAKTNFSMPQLRRCVRN